MTFSFRFHKAFSIGATSLVLALLPSPVPAESPDVAVPSTRPMSPAPYPYEIGAGIQGLASGSTDVCLVDVVETKPRHAMEGARDTVKLRIVRTLMGRPAAGETVELYYHLLWIDERSTTLEPPKFEVGRQVFVFLRSHMESYPGGEKKVRYALADQWLGVLPDRPGRSGEVGAAIRFAHGDTRGAWSESVGAYRGRLVAYRDEPKAQTPVVSVFLDLNNVTGGRHTSEFDLSKATFKWEVTDENGKAVAPMSPAHDWARILLDQRSVLESRGNARQVLSNSGAKAPPYRRGYLTLVPGKSWTFEQDDQASYFLSGTIEMPFVAEGVWYGTLALPRVAVPL